ncbi:MAG: hypothetical protein ACI80V_001044 [Rhodothermales bacterium]|jgi:hypothetical protein
METGLAVNGQSALDRLLTSVPAQKALSLHEAHPRRAAAAFFMAGVGWDAATIFRIDSVLDNVIISAYLMALTGLYAAATLHEAGRLTQPTLVRFVRWFGMASQFLMGALFSMFVFFYSQSASWSETSIFLIVLVGFLIANEVLHDRMFSARLRMALLFFVLASYLVYFVPILMGAMSHLAFLSGLLAAASIVGLVTFGLWSKGVFRQPGQLAWTGVTVAILLVFLEAAYLLNWIPPVPMAVREAGVYHQIRKTGDEYKLRYAAPPWYLPFARDESPFLYSPGDTVAVYTAVFAPTRIRTGIVHVWENRADNAAEWQETDRIAYVVSGGRGNGYRGYTQKRKVFPGQWRVRVETDNGRLLTRVAFDVIRAPEPVNRWKWRTQ